MSPCTSCWWRPSVPSIRSISSSSPAGGVMDVNTALPEVLKTALIHDGLARGIREAAKALDKRQAHLCVLAANCDEPMYVMLVEALCAEHQINLIKQSCRRCDGCQHRSP
ncbi:small ribosomal subunit protein eS12-like [Pelmatolapia mariae]|uniref:small ribosomal subunit protein eS12-like n=1 Tax=Pelmatolapia mariae TaxID=158779 RepID=UPI002FE5FBD3